MRSKVISDQLAILHHEANTLEFGNVGDRVSGNEIGEFSGFHRARAILPAQHIRLPGGRSQTEYPSALFLVAVQAVEGSNAAEQAVLLAIYAGREEQSVGRTRSSVIAKR